VVLSVEGSEGESLSLRSSLNVSDQVSHPYKTGKFIVLYILIFKYLVYFEKCISFVFLFITL
jgi:hypothetical protein